MKKIMFIILCVVTTCFFSCTDMLLSDGEKGKQDRADVLKTWQDQVSYAQQKSVLAKSSLANELTLVRYTYKGKVENQEQIMNLSEQLFADDVDVVMYQDKVNYEIVHLGTYLQ